MASGNGWERPPLGPQRSTTSAEPRPGSGNTTTTARRGGARVFVEVKARRSRSFGLPEEAITPSKRRRIVRSAWTYLDDRGLQGSAWRGDVIAIVGAPATGKSALALVLAEAFAGEIVSVDSRLLYRGMDIGTAKPTTAERSRVPHHLIDVADPDETGSLA